ncbi:MAG: hypothetical protein EU531_05330 [Promethearchaeota archaeon]|nr:MAG: hypothetical protein EU531_05330 [Candidatus Lokiarchaeota archaeon]
MNLKKNYSELYQHWLAEFDQIELTPLFQEDFNLYKKYVNKIKATDLQDDDALKKELLESYKAHFEFLLEDLLKIRKIKIMNAAFSLQEINLEYILEPEKLLYQNLIRSIKGYEKLKKFSVIEDYQSDEMVIEFLPSVSDKEKSKIESETTVQVIDEVENTNLEEPTKFVEPEVESVVENVANAKINYIIIRFVKDTPPLVGIDLKNYGPFNANDIASIPYKNAIILLNEKFAEKVDLA